MSASIINQFADHIMEFASLSTKCQEWLLPACAQITTLKGEKTSLQQQILGPEPQLEGASHWILRDDSKGTFVGKPIVERWLWCGLQGLQRRLQEIEEQVSKSCVELIVFMS